jgi:lactoylglutathione lyase
MILEHAAIWASDLEALKNYYTRFFNARVNDKYINENKQFRSYFLSFDSGARLEIMTRPDIPDNANDPVNAQYKGIIHLAFGVNTIQEVDDKAKELNENGYLILSGPRKTGDGYYEFETLDPENNRIEVTTNYS